MHDYLSYRARVERCENKVWCKIITRTETQTLSGISCISRVLVCMLVLKYSRVFVAAHIDTKYNAVKHLHFDLSSFYSFEYYSFILYVLIPIQLSPYFFFLLFRLRIDRSRKRWYIFTIRAKWSIATSHHNRFWSTKKAPGRWQVLSLWKSATIEISW